MNTNQIGNIAEAYVIGELIKRGFNISIPFSECRYDLVAEKNGYFSKIQVKYVSRPTKRQTIPIILHSIGRKGRIKYNSQEVDFVVAYFEFNRNFYIVPAKVFNGRTVLNLRFGKARNNQNKNIVWASKFEEQWNLIESNGYA